MIKHYTSYCILLQLQLFIDLSLLSNIVLIQLSVMYLGIASFTDTRQNILQMMICPRRNSYFSANWLKRSIASQNESQCCRQQTSKRHSLSSLNVQKQKKIIWGFCSLPLGVIWRSLKGKKFNKVILIVSIITTKIKAPLR